MDFLNILNPNKEAAQAAAIAKAQGLFSGAQKFYGLTGAGAGGAQFNFAQTGNFGGAFNGTPAIPNLAGIPGADRFGNKNVNLGGINSSIAALQKKYGVKIAGKENQNSEQALQSILASANTPLTLAEATANSYAFFDRIIKENLKKSNDPNNADAQEIERLQQDIASIQQGE